MSTTDIKAWMVFVRFLTALAVIVACNVTRADAADSSIHRLDEANLVVLDRARGAPSQLAIFIPGTDGKPQNAIGLLKVVASQGYRAAGAGSAGGLVLQPERWFAEYHRRENTAQLIAQAYTTLHIPAEHIRILIMAAPPITRDTSPSGDFCMAHRPDNGWEASTNWTRCLRFISGACH